MTIILIIIIIIKYSSLMMMVLHAQRASCQTGHCACVRMHGLLFLHRRVLRA
jgi:hypothetical protein